MQLISGTFFFQSKFLKLFLNFILKKLRNTGDLKQNSQLNWLIRLIEIIFWVKEKSHKYT